MKRSIIVSIVAAMLVVSGIAYAAGKSSKGKVESVDGTTITIKLEKSIDVKAGDNVKVESLGDKKPGFGLQGC